MYIHLVVYDILTQHVYMYYSLSSYAMSKYHHNLRVHIRFRSLLGAGRSIQYTMLNHESSSLSIDACTRVTGAASGEVLDDLSGKIVDRNECI